MVICWSFVGLTHLPWLRYSNAANCASDMLYYLPLVT